MLISLVMGFYQLPGEYFLHNSQGGCLGVLDLCGGTSMILCFTEDFFDSLNSRGAFSVTYSGHFILYSINKL